MRIRFVTLLITIWTLNGVSAQYKEKGVFLIDSVNYGKLAAYDRNLLDSVLTLYHQAGHDTTKLMLVGILADGLYDGELWPRYNRFLYDETMKLQQNRYDGKTWARIMSFRSNAINNFGYIEYNKGNVDKALDYYKKSSKIQKSINYLLGYSHTLNNIGAVFKSTGDLDSALTYYRKSYDIEMEIRDTLAAIQSINNIGEVHKTLGDLKKSQSYYLRGLKLSELSDDDEKIAQTNAYLGELYKSQKNFFRAKEHYDKALAIHTSIGNTEGIAHGNNNLGSLYLTIDSVDLALTYFERALDGYTRLGYSRGISGVYSNLSTIYRRKKKFRRALEFSHKSLLMKKKMKDREGESSVNSELSLLFTRLNELDSALHYANQANKLATQLDQLRLRRDAQQALYTVFKRKGDLSEALRAYERFVLYRDSMVREEDKIALIENQFKYDAAKKAYSDSIEDANELLVYQQEVAEHKLVAERQKINNYVLWGSLGILALVSIAIFWAFVNKKRSNDRISKKHSELELQKLLVEEKNEQIIDSINYAKRIQTALLKTDDDDNPKLPPHFVLYKPKDIVSGDFYWIQEKAGFLYLCVADCTGHGVPGAFMSMLGIAFLQEIMSATGDPGPHDIMNRLRERITEELSQTGDLNAPKDGMDASIIKLNIKTGELQWCGANNGLFVVSDNDYSVDLPPDSFRLLKDEVSQNMLTEVLPQRQSVGYEKHAKPFQSKSLRLNRGDQLYLYTDGYSDQFGGPRKKKYKLSQLKRFLLKNHSLDLLQQRECLEKEFYAWKGDLEQIDDICIVGIRV